MWCHLCTEDFSDFQAFKTHIIEKHRNVTDSKLCKESSESEEYEHEISDDEKDSSNMPQINYCDLEPIMTTENMSQENGHDSDNSMAAIHQSDDATSRENCYDSDNNVAAESNSDDKTSVHNTSPKKRNLCSSNTRNKSAAKSGISNKSSIKLQKSNGHSNTANKSQKKLKLSSVLKKRVPKKKKKVVFNKKVLPKRRMSAVLYQEDSPEHSDSNEADHYKNSQVAPSTSICDPEPVLVSNYVNSQPIPNNNSFFLNPYVGQGVNNYVTGNQAVQMPVYVVNTVVPNSTTSKTVKSFKFTSSNILKWLNKHKELFKNIPYPLPISLFNIVKNVHKAIFDHYCTASVSEESSAVLKVYEELDCIIHKHINSIHYKL